MSLPAPTSCAPRIPARSARPPRPQRPQVDTEPQVLPTLPATRLHVFLWGARQHQLDTDALLAPLGIPLADSTSRACRVSIAQAARALRRVIWRLRDEFLGFCDRPVKPGTLALAVTAMRRARNLGDALVAGAGIYRLAIDDFAAHVRISQGTARLVLVDKTELRYGRFVHCAFLYWALGLACWLVQQRIPVLEATLRYTAPLGPNNKTHHLFGVPLRFEQSHSSVSFDARWLSQPVVTDLAQQQLLLRNAPAPLLMGFQSPAALDVRVRQYLRRQLTQGMSSLEQTAWSLRLSPHALRRRLALQGTSFQSIKNALRRDAAIDMLTQSALSIEDIAERLAFSELSTFHRSFKRWTGLTPAAYRRAQERQDPKPAANASRR